MTGLSRREFIRLSACAFAAVLTAGCVRETDADSPVDSTLTGRVTPSPQSTVTATASVLEVSPGTRVPKAPASSLSLHPFIEAHPEAVFIRRTNVPSKTDSDAKKQEGLKLAASLFAPGDLPGIPWISRLAIKANLTCAQGMGNTEAGMGILTDRFFLEGLCKGLQEASFPAEQMYLREGNWLAEGYCPSELLSTGYPEMTQRIGVHLTDFPGGKQANQLSVSSMAEGSEIIWKEVPEGVVFKRIPYVVPYNASDSWLLDVAKLKTHGMGLTLSVKNLQGMVVPPYTRFCEGVENTLKHPQDILDNFQPELESRVEQLYQAHKKAGYPRWDKPGRSYDSGYGMEMWCQRTCDSHSVTKVGLAMVEGIYGRNGNAFMEGPGPDGTAQDFMMNLVIFGKNPFLVDSVAVWLAGHEPGNLGLFHIASERGLSPLVNPLDIPLYLWEDEPRLASLESFERTSLLTNYLRKDYAGESEPVWHMLNQPYDYGASTRLVPASPGLRVLGTRNPGRANASTVIEYCLPATSYATLGIFDEQGEQKAVLFEGLASQGTHPLTWYHDGSPGAYTFRLRVEGHEKAANILLD